MNKSRKLQLFIHRHYDSIKLLLLVIILLLVTYLLGSILLSNAQASKARGEAVIDIVSSIERETDEQTKIINRQFQAICFLMVETSGADALKKLDPPLEEQCRDLARELKRENDAQATANPQHITSPQRTENPQQANSPQKTSNPQPIQTPAEEPETPQEESSLLRNIIAPIRGLLGGE